MSNKDKPSVVQHSVPASVVATRWWWVRHAPVREDNGCIYGQEDIGCDTSDRMVFEAVWKIPPRDPVWYTRNLNRSHPTTGATLLAGVPQHTQLQHLVASAGQHVREWDGVNRRG